MNNLELQNKQLISGSDLYNTQMLYFTSSSLTSDDKHICLISDRDAQSPNLFVRNLKTGSEKQLTFNHNGYLKSYVYFDGNNGIGLSKASVTLDPCNNILFYIQDNRLFRVDFEGTITELSKIPNSRVTAFTHVSSDGKKICVPMTDARCLEYNPETEGEGLDKRPRYNIDERVQSENLSSYLCVYDTETGELLYEKTIPRCWITHVQFNPHDSNIIMYNHEWPYSDCGIRRIWVYNREKDIYVNLRTTSICNGKYPRKKEDWVCHEMWSDDGKSIIYHGAYNNGPAFIGRIDVDSNSCWEIALPEEYNAYGHFTMNHQGDLVCDGYFKMEGDIKKIYNNSTDNGPDPHKKDAEYISIQKVDWDNRIINWKPLCKHNSDWMGQDAHPHAIYNHKGDKIYFSSRIDQSVRVYCVDVCK